MSNYEALTTFDKGTIRLFFENFGASVRGGEGEDRALHDTRLRLCYALCNVVYRFRIVEGVTNATKALTVTDIRLEDMDLIEGLLTLYKYKYVNSGRREGGLDERLFLNIVYRRFDNLVLKYY
jgi:hypothetical protein